MLKLLVLCLIVKATASAVEMDETEGSADIGDDEDYVKRASLNLNSEHTGNSDKSRGDSEDGVTTIIIIVAVSTIVLILVVIGAIFLVKHYMHDQLQGMYAVPAEQAQKGTI
ncbi:uncharacterized protein [Paramormyrops kingsleyae]|uniref:uncharacterized protein n=1 Tax=Paramormyrops kingsleyae TaxID=1676925 RepID=UPI003B977F0F